MSEVAVDLAKNLACMIVAMVGFWLIEARYYIYREEAERMVMTLSPYEKDKSYILSNIRDMSDYKKELQKILKDNTDAVNSLKIEIAVLNNTLKKLENGK